MEYRLRMSLALVNSNARRFVEDYNFIILKNNFQGQPGVWHFGGPMAWAFLEGNVELNAISGSDEIVRFGSSVR